MRGADAAAAGFDEGRLVGAHNRENVAVAAALARALGVDDEAIRAAVRAFQPVAHRLERVAEIDGVALVERLQGDERRRDPARR